MEVPLQVANLSAAKKAVNAALSKVRVAVRWIFKGIKMNFATVDLKKRKKIRQAPASSLYLASMLLCTFSNCIYLKKVVQYFDCRPPTLEEYVYHI